MALLKSYVGDTVAGSASKINAAHRYLMECNSAADAVEFIRQSYDTLITSDDEQIARFAEEGYVTVSRGFDKIPGVAAVLSKIMDKSRATLVKGEIVKTRIITFTRHETQVQRCNIKIQAHFGRLDQYLPGTIQITSDRDGTLTMAAIAECLPESLVCITQNLTLVDLTALLTDHGSQLTVTGADRRPTHSSIFPHRKNTLGIYLDDLKTQCEAADKTWLYKDPGAQLPVLINHIKDCIASCFTKVIHGKTIVVLPNLPDPVMYKIESTQIDYNPHPITLIDRYVQIRSQWKNGTDFETVTTHQSPLQMLLSVLSLKHKDLVVEDPLNTPVDAPSLTLHLAGDYPLVINSGSKMAQRSIKVAMDANQPVYMLIDKTEDLKTRGNYSQWFMACFDAAYFMPLISNNLFLVMIIGEDGRRPTFTLWTNGIIRDITQRIANLSNTVIVLPKDYSRKWAKVLGVPADEHNQVLIVQRRINTLSTASGVEFDVTPHSTLVKDQDKKFGDTSSAPIILGTPRGDKRDLSDSESDEESESSSGEEETPGTSTGVLKPFKRPRNEGLIVTIPAPYSGASDSE